MEGGVAIVRLVRDQTGPSPYQAKSLGSWSAGPGTLGPVNVGGPSAPLSKVGQPTSPVWTHDRTCPASRTTDLTGVSLPEALLGEEEGDQAVDIFFAQQDLEALRHEVRVTLNDEGGRVLDRLPEILCGGQPGHTIPGAPGDT